MSRASEPLISKEHRNFLLNFWGSETEVFSCRVLCATDPAKLGVVIVEELMQVSSVWLPWFPTREHIAEWIYAVYTYPRTIDERCLVVNFPQATQVAMQLWEPPTASKMLPRKQKFASASSMNSVMMIFYCHGGRRAMLVWHWMPQIQRTMEYIM